MCVHIHTKVHTHVCALPSLPCLAPAPVGRVSWRNIPSREQLLKDLIRHFYIQLTACNIPFKKNIICLLAWSVTKIIFTSMTLTVSGQEAERLCRLRCFPAPLGRPPENSAAVSEERVRPLSLWLMLLAVPLAKRWEGEWHARETCLPQPYTCDNDIQSKTTRVLNLGREYYFFL